MAEITAKMVKDLRECTGAGMMDCKKALTETGGDLEKAVDVLRTKGLADLAKKAGRATNEGVIAAHVTEDGRVGSLVEVNCETDFVARNADFKAFVGDIARQVALQAPANVEALLEQPYADMPSISVQQYVGEKVTKIGENMNVARFTRYELGSEHGVVAAYIHGVGNIGVLVEAKAGSPEAAASEAFRTFAKDVAMQIAAAAPVSVGRDEVPAETVEHELAIYKAQAAESGKPEAIQEKMATGRLEKYYKESVLNEQVFVKNPDITISQLAKQVSGEAGATVEVVRFTRYVLGEGAK